MGSYELEKSWIAKRQALGLPIDPAARRAWEAEAFSPKPPAIQGTPT